MKILVLNGSPKGEKSDTMHVTRAFLEGMNEAAPQEVHIIDVIDKHIEYCRGCFACWNKTPGTCVLQDGFENMGALIHRAEEIRVMKTLLIA